MDAPPVGESSSDSGSNLPFDNTQVLHRLVSSDGVPLQLEIAVESGKRNLGRGPERKGFVKEGNTWVCYRRNYIDVSCSFALYPPPENAAYLSLVGSETDEQHQIEAFGITISAFASDSSFSYQVPVEIIQHRPQRDAETASRPEMKYLAPSNVVNQLSSINVHGPPLPPILNFERLQFRKATQQSGINRVYCLMVGLWARIRTSTARQAGPDSSSMIMIAHRISAPIEVRGRAPHFFHKPRSQSSGSAGSEMPQRESPQPSTGTSWQSPPWQRPLAPDAQQESSFSNFQLPPLLSQNVGAGSFPAPAYQLPIQHMETTTRPPPYPPLLTPSQPAESQHPMSQSQSYPGNWQPGSSAGYRDTDSEDEEGQN